MAAKGSNQTTYTIAGLQKKAEQYVRANWQNQTATWNMGPIIAIEFNPGLKDGCPALQKYCNGYKSLGLTDLKQNTMFAWHGTPTVQNIASICHNGFDPTTRKRQRHGAGEYFGVGAGDSHGFTGNTDRLIVVQLLKCHHVATHVSEGCHVVNNPTSKLHTYVLPVLLVTYRNRAPLSIPWITGTKGQIPHPFTANGGGGQPWCWIKDDGRSEPFDASTNALLKIHYQSFRSGGPSSIIIGNITRYSDGQAQYYIIDFANWTQTNYSTGFVRRIKRKTGGEQCWYWKEDGNVSMPYPSSTNDAIEGYYQAYVGGNGPTTVRVSKVTRNNATLSYTIDFGSMTQTNDSTGYVRAVERGH